MVEPILALPLDRVNDGVNSGMTDDDFDVTFHDPPSSPFVSHIDFEQENVAPNPAYTPVRPLDGFEDITLRSALKTLPEDKSATKARASPTKMSPMKNLTDGVEEEVMQSTTGNRMSPRKSSPLKSSAVEQPKSTMSSVFYDDRFASENSCTNLAELTHEMPEFKHNQLPTSPTAAQPQVPPLQESTLCDNEGLTIAMMCMRDLRTISHEASQQRNSQNQILYQDADIENIDSNPDGPEHTSADMDDTCFSTFSEMPGMDLTKLACLKQMPLQNDFLDATPRTRSQIIPSNIPRTEHTPSPTPRRTYKENDTTNLLLDFTAQIESFASSHRKSPARGHTSPGRSIAEPKLRSYYQTQRSPNKSASRASTSPTRGRQMFNLLDFELPPPPTPRSQPTVTIRELESLKSQFQSQISSLTASLSGKEAEVESLSKAVADAERRVGEALETVRDERSVREHAEAQMIDWKKKGEEVQKLLQDVQSELARNDTEREDLFARLSDAERRADDADARSSELETRAIEAESRNVDMTTFVHNENGSETEKIYSEVECQAAIAEKVNEVARDLHTAYKAKHEKKIKALKDNYQKKADERCKELRVQIIRLERQVEEAEKKRDNTFSKISPDKLSLSTEEHRVCAQDLASGVGDKQKLEEQRTEMESLKAKLAGLQSELQSLRLSQDILIEELETERTEKGELVAAAEQMLAMCGERMEELQQEDLRRSQTATVPTPAQKQPAAPEQAMRTTGFLAGGSTANTRPGSALGGGRPGSAMGDRLGVMSERGGTGVSKPSGLRAPGGFGFQSAPSMSRSTSGAKSRLLSNIERMGGGKE